MDVEEDEEEAEEVEEDEEECEEECDDDDDDEVFLSFAFSFFSCFFFSLDDIPESSFLASEPSLTALLELFLPKRFNRFGKGENRDFFSACLAGTAGEDDTVASPV